MCKVFAMTNTTQFKVNRKFLSIVRNEVCRHADQDGFGYAVLSKNGEIGGERTIRPLNFMPLIDPAVERVVDKLGITLQADNGFGEIDLANSKSVIAHGRLATNEICLANTHPFTNGEVALIHNGVVSDPTGSLKNLTSTCDTEYLLRYWERGGIDQIEKYISGYYAVAILDKTGLLHIIRDDRADLFITYCRSVDSFIIATTSEIIRNVAKEMKWKIEHPEEILEKTYTVFNSNEIVSHKEITPRTFGSTYGMGHHSSYNYNDDYRNRSSGNSSAISSSVHGRSGTQRYNEEYNDDGPTEEVVPNTPELTGQVATESSDESTATALTESLESGTSSSVSVGPLISDTSDGGSSDSGPVDEDKINFLVNEVNDWRSRRTGSDL